MYKYFFLIIILFSTGLRADAKPLKDPINNNLIQRIVSLISVKCKLPDLTKKELSKHFYYYYIEVKKISSDRKQEATCFGNMKLSLLKKNFLDGLRNKFGEAVYRFYKIFTEGCTDGQTRSKILLNRITERTSE
jgi:hypothetical protein